MNRVETKSNGISLVATRHGEHPEILLLHAGGERRHVWRPIQDRLARSGINSIAYDQRGHGDSDGSTADGIEAYASDAGFMLQSHPSIRLAVGGSLGGLSLLMACANEEVQTRLSGLVLVDVVPAPESTRVRTFLSNQSVGLARSPLVDSILSRSDSCLQAATRLSLPLLLVRAGKQGPMTNAEVRHLRSLCPQLCVTHIDHAGHLIARDAPTLLADAILEFEQSERVRSRSLKIG